MEYSNVYKMAPAPNNLGIRNWCGVMGDKHMVQGLDEYTVNYIPPHPSMMRLRNETHSNNKCDAHTQMIIQKPQINLHINNRMIYMFLLTLVIIYILYVTNASHKINKKFL